jgi:hypothetical protein
MYQKETFLTQRERYLRFIDQQRMEDIPNWGDWVGPYEAWVSQGMPPDPCSGGSREWSQNIPYFVKLFGFEGVYSAYWGTGRIPVNISLLPVIEEKVLEETEEYIVSQDGEGAAVKQFRINTGTIISRQYVGFSLKGRENWNAFRDKHLDPYFPGRYPDDRVWKQLIETARKRDFIITLDCGSFYGCIRNWMGTEQISYAFYDDPGWLKEAVNYLADFYIKVLSRAVKDIPDIDCGLFWEDMCFKNGPLCSPQQFREFFLPVYIKVTSYLKEHGVRSLWVDCDGNIEQLMDLFIEGGVNGFYPLEVSAGMDPVSLKLKYGKEILIWGGIDKRELSKGSEDIDRELARIAPAVRMGGYIPLADHSIPDDVPYLNYVYYLEKKKKMFDIRQLPDISGLGPLCK